MTVEQIISRAEAIRLPRNVLVKEARVANSTVLRAMVNGGGKVKTLQALAAVVVSHELRMLAYLAALHPKEAADGL